MEIYEYEKDISLYQRPRRRAKSDVPDPVLAPDGGDPLSERQLGKRRDNARRAQLAFSRFVRSNIDGVVSPILLTLTYAENQENLRIAYGDFRSFSQALRYRFGKGFRYICVPEFQKRGAVHFHALIWGLPESVLLQERNTREIALLWGLGFVYIKPTDGSEKLSTYLAKYMTKAYLDPRLAHCKAYVGSRNCARPKVMSNFSPIWPVLEDYEISTKPCLQEKHYMTQWLGRGKYRRYQLRS